MSQSLLFPIRIFVLATIAMSLFVSQANAFRIFHVANSSGDKSPPTVRYMYPKSFKLDDTLYFSDREQSPAPVIINQMTTCYCPQIDVYVTPRRRVGNRRSHIKVHQAGSFDSRHLNRHRAAEFRRSRIPLNKAGIFNY